MDFDFDLFKHGCLCYTAVETDSAGFLLHLFRAPGKRWNTWNISIDDGFTLSLGPLLHMHFWKNEE